MKFELQNFNRNVPDKALLEDLATAGITLKARGRSVTFCSYKGIGKYAPSTIVARFGSWNDGLRAAGLAPTEEKNISVQTPFDNLKLVWIAKGKQPVYRDMSFPPSLYTGTTYNDRFGGWRNSLEAFVATVKQEEVELHKFEASVKSRKVLKRTARDPSLALRFLVLKRDRFCCVACGRSPATVASLVLEIDHVLAWSKGGETIEENLQTLCFDCNRGKGAV